MRVAPKQLDEILHYSRPRVGEEGKVIARSSAGPGGAVGKIVFTSEAAIEAAAKGERVILVREETNPEDVEGMRAAVGLLTSREV